MKMWTMVPPATVSVLWKNPTHKETAHFDKTIGMFQVILVVVVLISRTAQDI